jgi:hypothetical protein
MFKQLFGITIAALTIGLSQTAVISAANATIIVTDPSPNATWQKIPGCAPEISARYVIGCANAGPGGNQILRKSTSWDGLPGAGVKIAGEEAGYWHLERNGAIRFNNVLQPGCAKEIASGLAGVWVTGCAPTNGGFEIYRANRAYTEPVGRLFSFPSGAKSWQLMPGGATKLAVGSQAWAVNDQGQIFRFEDANNQWQSVPGCARSIGASGNAVWVIGCDRSSAAGHEIFEWKNGEWYKHPGAAAKISVDRLGNPWVVTDQGEIFNWIRREDIGPR